MSDKLCLFVCQNFEREAQTIVQAEWPDEVMVRPFFACCGRPSLTWSSLREAVHSDPAPGTLAFLAGGVCVRSLGDPPPQFASCVIRSVDLCFELFVPKSFLEGYLREGAYLLTPGWLAVWRDHLRRWGFDQNTARDYFAESTTSLILLDTEVDSHSTRNLEEFAEYVARPYRTVRVGLDHFRLVVKNIVLGWKLEHKTAHAQSVLDESNRKLGDYAMASDLLGWLTGLRTEAQVIEGIIELFTMLFAPQTLLYMPLSDGVPGPVRSQPLMASEDPTVVARLLELRDDYAWMPSGTGFWLRAGERDTAVGILEIDGIAFPEYKQHYLNLALNLAKICSLAIHNARANDQLQKNIEALQEALANVKTLSGLVPICSTCKKIRDDRGFWNQVEVYVQRHSTARFTHGICPECMKKYYSDIYP